MGTLGDPEKQRVAKPPGSPGSSGYAGIVDPTVGTLARLRRFARSMSPELPAVDVALGEVCRLLEDCGADFKLVGGVAVVHHGYARTTEHVDVLIAEGAVARSTRGSRRTDSSARAPGT